MNRFPLLSLFAVLLVLAGCYTDDDGITRITAGDAGEADYGVTENASYRPARIAAPSLPQAKKKWSILVYMCADNNLSSYSAMDIAEMQKSGSDDNVNIAALWDNDPSQEDGKQSQKHGYYYIEKAGVSLLKDVGEVNMGNPATAEAFIDFAAVNMPAERYMFIYWNHGGAVDRSAAARGVAWDDTNGGDHLTELEQKEIMAYFKKKIGKKIDIVGFDACLMATAEIAVQYKDTASYLIASEETIAGEGWDYSFLSKLKSSPSMTPKTLCKHTLNYYSKYYADQPDATLSVLDLSQAGKLASAIDAFAVSAMNSGVAKGTFKKLAGGLGMFGVYASGSKNCYYTKDLYSYMNSVGSSALIPQDVKDSAGGIMSLISGGKLIPYEWHGKDWSGSAYGITITLKYATSVYRKLDLCVKTSWDEFLNWAGFPNNDYAN
jgi:hypothetical protein